MSHKIGGNITGHRSLHPSCHLVLAKPSGRTPHSLRAGHFESAQGHSASRAAAASTSPLRGGKLLAEAILIGDCHVKTATALSLMSGQPNVAAGKHRTRGDINTLIVGDPGQHEFLKYIGQTFPHAVTPETKVGGPERVDFRHGRFLHIPKHEIQQFSDHA